MALLMSIHNISFILFNEMKRFLSKIEFDIFTVSNNESMIFKYSVLDFFFSRNRISHEFWVNNTAKNLNPL